MSDYVEPDFDEDFEEVPPPVPFYTQTRGERTNFPFSCDCSGLVWWNFNRMGLDKGLFPGPDAGVADMIHHFEATRWRYADLLMRWNDNYENTVAARNTLNLRYWEKSSGVETDVEMVDLAFLQEGDLLYRYQGPTGEGDHVSWFVRWEGGKQEGSVRLRIYDAHPTATPAVGERTVDYDYLIRSYTHAVRPQAIGALMTYRYAASVTQPVPVGGS